MNIKPCKHRTIIRDDSNHSPLDIYFIVRTAVDCTSRLQIMTTSDPLSFIMWDYGSIVLKSQHLTFSWKVQEVKMNGVGLHVHIIAGVCVNMAHHSYCLCNTTQCYAIDR